MKQITGNSSNTDGDEQTQQPSTIIVDTGTVPNFIAARSLSTCLSRCRAPNRHRKHSHPRIVPPTIGSSLGRNRSTASGLQ